MTDFDYKKVYWNSQVSRSQTTVALIGLTCVFVFFLLIPLSVQLSPSFSWAENYLSQLAGNFGDSSIWNARGISSIVFNFGIFLTGICGVLFSVMLKKNRVFSSRIGSIGAVLLFIDMSALSAAGLFPLTLGKPHVWASYALFCFMPFVIITIGYELGRMFGKRWFWISGLLCMISLLSICISMFIPAFGLSRAIAEMIILSDLFIVLIIYCVNSLKNEYSLKSFNLNFREMNMTKKPSFYYNMKLFKHRIHLPK